MNDDWRLRIDVHAEGSRQQLHEHLEADELEHDLEDAFHDRVIVSEDGAELFCYAGTREQAERAAEVIRSLAAGRGWQVETELRHWHPDAEEWEDPDELLPSSDAEHTAEHESMIEHEREESTTTGAPDFEVRVQCRSHRDAIELADKLQREGLPCVRRWRYLLIGAADEDAAKVLADRIRDESPPGSVVSSEGSWRAVRALRPGNPFAVFGGLGG